MSEADDKENDERDANQPDATGHEQQGSRGQERKSGLSLKGWIGIVAALVTIVTGVVGLPKVFRDSFPKGLLGVSPGDSLGGPEKPMLECPFPNLSEEHIRMRIGKALEGNQVDTAIELLSCLGDPKVHDEECDHIFRFCMSNLDLNCAGKVAPLFVSDQKRLQAEEDLELEKLKGTE